MDESKTMHDEIKVMAKDLDDCPFCGSDKMGSSFRRVKYSRNPVRYKVRFKCMSCHCGTGFTLYPWNAVNLWNRAPRWGIKI